MTRIGIISDTHGYWDDKFLTYFEKCDEIWHAGDICSSETIVRLQAPGVHTEPCRSSNPARRRIVRVVCGNCDGGDLRRMFPEVLRFKCEDVVVLMKHIGGYPGKYDRSIQRQIYANPPQLFISAIAISSKFSVTRSLGSCTSIPVLQASRVGTWSALSYA